MPNADADLSVARPRWQLSAAIVVGILAVDQLTKAWAVSELEDGPISIIGDDVELHLTYNSGGAFSLFRGFTPLLAVLAIVIAVVLVRSVRQTQDRWTLVALSLVLAGALGNLADRAFRPPSFLSGKVVDFVSVGSFPTFNVADSAITIGAILLVILAFIPRAHEA
ncbi:MAG: signal peptidase II [Actinobacteria bacterium]|nr:signal peptidase II [Actinomycetota bacterium]